MDIVPADKTHADELAHLHIKAWKKAYAGIVPQDYLDSFSIENRKERFLQDLKEHPESTYVGIQDGSVVGFVTFGKYRDDDDQAGEICGIYLDPEYWRKGFGTKLAQWALDNLKKQGFTTIKLWAFEDNVRGGEFYKSFGFIPDGSIRKNKKFGDARIIRYTKDIYK